jgi:hypothetical protein
LSRLIDDESEHKQEDSHLFFVRHVIDSFRHPSALLEKEEWKVTVFVAVAVCLVFVFVECQVVVSEEVK